MGVRVRVFASVYISACSGSAPTKYTNVCVHDYWKLYSIDVQDNSSYKCLGIFVVLCHSPYLPLSFVIIYDFFINLVPDEFNKITKCMAADKTNFIYDLLNQENSHTNLQSSELLRQYLPHTIHSILLEKFSFSIYSYNKMHWRKKKKNCSKIKIKSPIGNVFSTWHNLFSNYMLNLHALLIFYKIIK